MVNNVLSENQPEILKSFYARLKYLKWIIAKLIKNSKRLQKSKINKSEEQEKQVSLMNEALV